MSYTLDTRHGFDAKRQARIIATYDTITGARRKDPWRPENLTPSTRYLDAGTPRTRADVVDDYARMLAKTSAKAHEFDQAQHARAVGQPVHGNDQIVVTDGHAALVRPGAVAGDTRRALLHGRTITKLGWIDVAAWTWYQPVRACLGDRRPWVRWAFAGDVLTWVASDVHADTTGTASVPLSGGRPHEAVTILVALADALTWPLRGCPWRLAVAVDPRPDVAPIVLFESDDITVAVATFRE